MGIWERLGRVIKSYLGDDNQTPAGNFGKGYSSFDRADPDLDSAYEELDGFLRGEETAGEKKDRGEPKGRQVPQELQADFAELGLTADASLEECKEAYKKLLKIYHPDRHEGNAENMKKATEKTTRVNAAYDRLEKWFRDGNGL